MYRCAAILLTLTLTTTPVVYGAPHGVSGFDLGAVLHGWWNALWAAVTGMASESTDGNPSSSADEEEDDGGLPDGWALIVPTG